MSFILNDEPSEWQEKVSGITYHLLEGTEQAAQKMGSLESKSCHPPSSLKATSPQALSIPLPLPLGLTKTK